MLQLPDVLISARPSPAGAIEGLKSLKQARITDPTTGQSFGLVRLYADPGEPPATVVHKPARQAKTAAHHRGNNGAASSKPVQVLRLLLAGSRLSSCRFV